MGVKDLWKLLESTGRPVSLDKLQGLILAIDVSVWLHQAVHGTRDRAGQPLQSAHLALLFSRICKLLHYQIKPVFVFDGQTPALKQQTLAQRKQKRQSAGKKGQKAEDKQRIKYMQAKILEQLTGETSSAAVPRSSSQPDLFDLPPLPEDVFNRDRSPVMEASTVSYLEDVGMIDIQSAVFASLPPELQHEILQERQEMERHSYTDPGTLPIVANDFSNYQLTKLMKRSKLSQQLEGVRKTLKSSDTIDIGLGGQSQSCEVEASRIMSSDSAHYILVRGVDLEGSSQDEIDEERNVRDDVIATSAGNDTSVHATSLKTLLEPQNLQKQLNASGEEKSELDSIRETCSDPVRSDNQAVSGEEVASVGYSAGLEYQAETVGSQLTASHTQGSGVTSTELSSQDHSHVVSSTSSDVSMMVSHDRGSERDEPAATTGRGTLGTAHLQQPVVIQAVVSPPQSEVVPTEAINGEPQETVNGEPRILKDDDACLAVTDKPQVMTDSDVHSVAPLLTTSPHSSVAIELTPSPHSPVVAIGDEPQITTDGSTHSVTLELTSLSHSPCIENEQKSELTFEASRHTPDGGSGDEKATPPDLWVEPTDTVTGKTGEDSDIGVSGEVGDIDGSDCDTGAVVEVGGSVVPGEICDSGDSGEDGARGETGEVGGGWESGVLQLSPQEAQSQLRQEVGELGREMERQRRAAAGVTSQIYREAQELLSLFGLPYIVSPMEAEAQCAHLDHTHQTHGTMTDDSDVFLFGGKRVYRHFFHQEREPTFYDADDIKSVLGLTQSKMVCLAYLLGSDYTAGLEGVGVVNAMEVIGHFQEEGMEMLKKLKEWQTQLNSAPGLTLKSSTERKVRDLVLPPDFPSSAVWQAYTVPEVDESTEQFQWGTPDLDLIRKYMSGHVGWGQERVDSVLLPVVKRVNSKQNNITSYFSPAATSSYLPLPPTVIKSSRLRNVVARITGGSSNQQADAEPPKGKRAKKTSDSSSDESEDYTSRERRGRRGRGRGKGKGRAGKQRATERNVNKRKRRKNESSPDNDTGKKYPKLSASSSSSEA